PRRARRGRPDGPLDGGQRLQRPRDRRSDRSKRQRDAEHDVPRPTAAARTPVLDGGARMIGHKRALELSAAAFDFELSPDDDAALTAHLETCESCRAIAEGLRADAVALVGLERTDAPADLRARILEAATGSEEIDDAPAAVPTPQRRPTLLRFPESFPARFRQ